MILVENNVLPKGEVSIKDNRILVDGKDFTPATKNGKFKVEITYEHGADNALYMDGRLVFRLLPGQSASFIVG